MSALSNYFINSNKLQSTAH
uniref:Uncharacterized protein n=1 Tax=Arundo donax TaxID=35708 RepID=A0A0A9AG98_ARUDO